MTAVKCLPPTELMKERLLFASLKFVLLYWTDWTHWTENQSLLYVSLVLLPPSTSQANRTKWLWFKNPVHYGGSNGKLSPLGFIISCWKLDTGLISQGLRVRGLVCSARDLIQVISGNPSTESGNWLWNTEQIAYMKLCLKKNRRKHCCVSGWGQR